MGKLFTLDDSTKATISDALDDIITEFGKNCRLVYPPRWTRCTNCITLGNQTSTNRWRTGGPLPFANGQLCPLCSGKGQLAEEASEVIKFKVEWDPKKFAFPIPNLNLRVPHSVCMIKGYLTDVPKINMCDHMIIQLPIEGIISANFYLFGQPISPGSIVQNRYFTAMWEQRN